MTTQSPETQTKHGVGMLCDSPKPDAKSQKEHLSMMVFLTFRPKLEESSQAIMLAVYFMGGVVLGCSNQDKCFLNDAWHKACFLCEIAEDVITSDSAQRPDDHIPLSMFRPLNWERSKVRTFNRFDSFCFLVCP